MSLDPVVAEIHMIREQLAAKFNHDIAEIVRDVRERYRSGDRPVVSLPPRPAVQRRPLMRKTPSIDKCEQTIAAVSEGNERLTLEQMYQRYPDEWLVIGEPEKDEALAVKSGLILYHSRDRDAAYRRAVEMRPGRFAFHFTGKMPEGTAVAF